jgi:hypothetical protein
MSITLCHDNLPCGTKMLISFHCLLGNSFVSDREVIESARVLRLRLRHPTRHEACLGSHPKTELVLRARWTRYNSSHRGQEHVCDHKDEWKGLLADCSPGNFKHIFDSFLASIIGMSNSYFQAIIRPHNSRETGGAMAGGWWRLVWH